MDLGHFPLFLPLEFCKYSYYCHALADFISSAVKSSFVLIINAFCTQSNKHYHITTNLIAMVKRKYRYMIAHRTLKQFL